VEEINFIDHTTTISSDDNINNNNDNTSSIGDNNNNSGNTNNKKNNNAENKFQYQLQAINTVTNEKLRISCAKLVVATDPTNAKVIINKLFSKQSATTKTTTSSTTSASTDKKEDVFKIPRGRG
jgi:hypothetical protein